MKLKEIPLPEGDVPGFDIAYPGSSGRTQMQPTWLDEGYDGVHFIGRGISRTHLRPAGWDRNTCVIGNHAGKVRFSDMSIHAGRARAFLFGLENRNAVRGSRKFHLHLDQVQGVVPDPDENGRTFWWLHHYDADVTMSGVEGDFSMLSEHFSYGHSKAWKGHTYKDLRVKGCGGEVIKVRSPASECAWGGANGWVRVYDSEIEDWYKPHSNRGGCAINMQGSGMGLDAQRNVFRPGPGVAGIPGHQRSRAIMVTSESGSYDAFTGAVGSGFGNSWIVIKQCAAFGWKGTENYSLLLRVGKVGGSQRAAKGVLIDGCGLWGDHMQLQFSDIPTNGLAVKGCNTPGIRNYCDAIGMDTRSEASILTSSRIIPVSEGLVR